VAADMVVVQRTIEGPHAVSASSHTPDRSAAGGGGGSGTGGAGGGAGGGGVGVRNPGNNSGTFAM
jgi:hypothetical protein